MCVFAVIKITFCHDYIQMKRHLSLILYRVLNIRCFPNFFRSFCKVDRINESQLPGIVDLFRDNGLDTLNLFSFVV